MFCRTCLPMVEPHGFLSPGKLAVSSETGGCPASLLDGLPWMPSHNSSLDSALPSHSFISSSVLDFSDTGLWIKARRACACWLVSVHVMGFRLLRFFYLDLRDLDFSTGHQLSNNRMGFLCVCSDGFHQCDILIPGFDRPKEKHHEPWNHHQQLTTTYVEPTSAQVDLPLTFVSPRPLYTESFSAKHRMSTLP
ncbi:hypothetical protein LZ30DRAFT_200689 [Colletotrichum cereale]|nr:hypothetical protein LZ30DRAFT_200689 [Colletotrichum cereale]